MRVAVAIVLIGALAGTASADNPDFARARELAGRLEYRAAAVAVDAAIKRGTAGPAELAAMWRLAGILAGGLRQPEEAAGHFARALSIDPTVALPLGASPAITTPFAAAKSRLAGRRLGLRAAVDGRRVALEVDDPVSLVAGVRIERRAGGIVARLAAPPYETNTPGRAAESLIAIAVDAAGNRLGETGVEIAAAAPVDPGGGELDARRSVWHGPLPWLAGAAVAAAAGGTFGVLALRAQSDLDELGDRARAEPFSVTFEEIEETRDRGERRALIANIGFAVAGAAAITGGVIWLLGRGSSDRVEPAPGGVAVRF